MTITLTAAQEAKLRDVAEQSSCSVDEVFQRAFDLYFTEFEELAAAVRDGEDSAVREGWLTQDEVFEKLNQHLAKTA